MTDAENNTTSYTYDLYGNIATETRANESLFTYNYDVMGRAEKVYLRDSLSVNPVLQEEYSYIVLPNGNTQKTYIKHISDITTATTQFTYDYAGRLISQLNPDNTTITTIYNANGTVDKTTDAKWISTNYIYDGLNRLIEKNSPFETVNGITYKTINKLAYDKNGNVKDEQVSNNKPREATNYTTKVYNYNNRDLIVEVVLFNNGAPANYTQYYYDEEGNKVRMYTGLVAPLVISGLDNVTPSGDLEYETTKYEYSNMGEIIRMTDPLGMYESYAYDLNGNMVQKTDRNGNITDYTYNALNRLTNYKVTTPTLSTVEYGTTYDNMGNVVTTTGSGIAVSYTYDQKGRLLTESDITGIQKNYTYDYSNNRKTFIMKLNGEIEQNLSYNYDSMGRLAEVLDNGTVTATYTYDQNGNRETLAYNNGNHVVYTYNLANKLKTLTNINGSEIISQYAYNYYTDGNQASKTDLQNTTTAYTYDGPGRLINENVIQNGIETTVTVYTYDDYNNRKTKSVTGTGAAITSYDYDDNNRLITETDSVNGVKVYSYDNNGNTLGIPSTTAGGAVYTLNTYDGLNQLIQSSIDGLVASYSYNSDGLRTCKTVNGLTTSFIWDSGNIIASVSGIGFTETYIRGINLIERKSTTGVALEYYVFNGHGDVVQLTSTAGAITKSYDYDAFGNEKNPDVNDTNVFRYCGEYFDKETGTYYLRARYYDPEIGRFISEDSARSNKIKLPNGIKIDDPLSLNLYTYCYNDPVNLTDPSGNTARSAWDGFVKGIDDNMLGGYIGQFGGWLRNITSKDPVDWEEYYKLDSDYKNGYDTGELLSYLSALGGGLKSMTSPQSVLVTPNGQVITGYSPFGPTINMADKNDRKFNVNKQESTQWNSLGKVKGQDRKTSGAGKDKKYFEWDFTHNDIEVYDSKGKHLGSMNPTTGEIYKPAVKGRTIKIN